MENISHSLLLAVAPWVWGYRGHVQPMEWLPTPGLSTKPL